MLTRAYSILDIKSIDDDARVIEGIASTPTPDRMGDELDSKGAVFSMPMPLLWQHKQDQPIGTVLSATVTKDGIRIKAQIGASGLLPEIDRAWALIKSRLVRGLSIGWNPLEFAHKTAGGLKVSRWQWLELSAVTVPANQQASITLIKSLDAADLAALGTRARSSISHSPGVSGQRESAIMYSDQIRTISTDISEKSTSLAALMTKSQTDTLNDTESTERDTLTGELTTLNKNLETLRVLERSQGLQATPIGVPAPQHQSQQSTLPKVEVKVLEKGTIFTRYAMALAAGKGSLSDTLAYARKWEGETPELIKYIKAVAGTAIDQSPGWGSELAFQNQIEGEFIDLLRAATLVGRIPGFRSSPFNVRMARQTGGSTFDWVGEGGVKPAGEMAFDFVAVGNHKAAGIVVLTQELVRLSRPSAETTARNDLVEQAARFIDVQFIDPSVSAGPSNPASITNLVASPAASGVTADDLYADLNTALATFDDADQDTANLVIVMPPAVARGISTLRNALGQFEFTGLNPNGGMLMGYTVIVSRSVPAGTIVILNPSEIFLADDGRVTLDASDQATLDLAGGSSPTFSLWQRNCIALRAERWITWVKRRDNVVAIIDTASYGPQPTE